jgi:hypothetical protein
MILGAMIAAGSLAATAVRAQETDAGTEATATDRSEQPKRPRYGTYVKGPTTPDADGVPVADPNPMSEYMNDTEEGPPIDMPMVSPPPGNASGTDSATP